MPKYLFQGSYTVEGARGLLKEGGTHRRAVLDQMLRGLGGRLEAMYFAFGETDVFVIADVPDNVSSAAAALTVTTSGAVNVKTTVLITPEEMDQAARKTVRYTSPGA